MIDIRLEFLREKKSVNLILCILKLYRQKFNETIHKIMIVAKKRKTRHFLLKNSHVSQPQEYFFINNKGIDTNWMTFYTSQSFKFS